MVWRAAVFPEADAVVAAVAAAMPARAVRRFMDDPLE
jgi:hypothetical protein